MSLSCHIFIILHSVISHTFNILHRVMTRIHSSIQKIPNPCWKLFTIDRIPAAIKYSGVVVWLILFCLSVDSGAVKQWPQDQCLVINCESECWQHWPHSLSVSSLQWTRDTRASSLPDCEQQIRMNTSIIFAEVLKSSWCPLWSYTLSTKDCEDYSWSSLLQSNWSN